LGSDSVAEGPVVRRRFHVVIAQQQKGWCGMAKRKSADEDGGQEVPAVGESGTPSGAPGGSAPDKAGPVHEERIGRVKAVVWANQTANGIRHNVTLKRIFKREGGSGWEQSDSFGRDDLPLVMEVSKRAWLWIYANSQG
jgi:hypothetical protein